jgi:hypothetical protein
MNITTNNVEVSTPFFHENNTAAMNMTYDTNTSMESTHLQEGGVWGNEVSPPFFHENNTAAMNSYEAPLENAVTTEPLVTEENAVTVETAEPTQNSPEENTLFHMIQASLSYAAHKKQHNEECIGVGHPGCKTISDNIAKEYQKIEKGREIVMQLFKPTKLVEDTNPVPWRWENRTAVPVEERGACLLYRPVTYENASLQNTSQEAPFCFLHENDVVDNGTMMCLKARLDECVYGNETMKAMMKVLQDLEPLYRQEIKLPELPEFSAFVVWLIILFSVVGAWKRFA